MNESWGPWKLVERLGEGGQGHTFLVETEPITFESITSRSAKGFFAPSGKHVLKLLKKKEQIHRMKSEIEACKRLSHPGILSIVEHDLDADEPWLVSTYCPNGSLDKFWPLVSHTLAGTRVLSMFNMICDAVAHAHEHGIVHRDLKPENIFIAAGGNPVIGDFGICHIHDEPRFTQVNEPVGARHYIAPEAENGAVDNVQPTSDVYSLGKILYWLVWGTSFAREAHRESGPYFKLKDSTDTFDFLVYEILDKTIVRDPDARFADAGELRDFVATQHDRLEAHAHVVGPDAPQPCSYCGAGFYERVVDPRSTGPHLRSIEDFGLPHPKLGMQWMITACRNCGNVQFFRLDKMKDPQLWHTPK
jgi:serine/threonine protein kinase